MSEAVRFRKPVRFAILLTLIVAVSPRIVAVDTAGLVVPPSTAAQHTVTATGAVVLGVDFTVVGSGPTVTGAKVSLRGNHTLSSVSVAFASGPTVQCGLGVYTAELPGRTSFTCSGLSYGPAKSSDFTITVSPRA